jgi:hypothetical protein
MGKKISLVLTYIIIIALGLWANLKVVGCQRDRGAEDLCADICSEVDGFQYSEGVCYCCKEYSSTSLENCEEVIW